MFRFLSVQSLTHTSRVLVGEVHALFMDYKQRKLTRKHRASATTVNQAPTRRKRFKPDIRTESCTALEDPRTQAEQQFQEYLATHHK